MANYMLLTVGFEMPTPQIMQGWNAWFEKYADQTVEKGGLMKGREFSASGAKDLPMDLQAITGYMILSADSREEAERIAQENPYITSIQIYEIMNH